MVGELILLPVRVGVRATRVWLRVAEGTATVAANATGRLIGLASGGSDGRTTGARAMPESQRTEWRGVDSRDPASRTAGQSNVEPGRPDPGVSSIAASQAAAPPAPRHEARATPPPTHVSEEPELVEAFAEPGAEDGAGPEIHIEEPWTGYAQMNAKQVIARLNTATPAALAAVQLYESRHRRRQTILNAVQRELRGRNGSGSPNQ
jgi:hypothetical protein